MLIYNITICFNNCQRYFFFNKKTAYELCTSLELSRVLFPSVPQPEEAPAPAEPAGPLPEGVTQEMVAAGKQVFEGNGICFTCHGMDGKGTALAPDLTGGNWLWVDPAAGDLLGQIEARIKEGVPQPKEAPAPMPPMGGAQLTDEQVRDVAAYVYTLASE